MNRYLIIGLILIAGCLPKTELEKQTERADALIEMQNACDKLAEKLNNGMKAEVYYGAEEVLQCKLKHPKVSWYKDEIGNIDSVRAVLGVLRIKKNEKSIEAFVKCIEPYDNQELNSRQMFDSHEKCAKKTGYDRGWDLL